MARGRVNHWNVLLGLLVGAVTGMGANAFAGDDAARLEAVAWIRDWIAHPVGQVFLRTLFVVIVPLVLAGLAAAVARLGDPRELGRMGVRTALFFAGTMSFSAALGLVAMNLAAPGRGFDPAASAELLRDFAGEVRDLQASAKPGPGSAGTVNQVLDMFLPRNMAGSIVQMQMLPLITFSLLFGAALGTQPPARRDRVIAALDAVAEAMVWIVAQAMRLAPFAVACLIFVSASRFGLPLLARLSAFVALVLGLYALQLFGLYPLLVATLAGRAPGDFLRRCVPIMATAFSTSSSNATLPTSIETCERELGIRPSVANFVLPLGATVNMNGTALFEGCVVLFVAQVFGIDLTLVQQAVVLALCVVSAIGVAGVPGGSIPLLMGVMAQVGVPAEGIALVLGVDRLLDMGRTVVNVMGDVVAAAHVESRMPRALT